MLSLCSAALSHLLMPRWEWRLRPMSLLMYSSGVVAITIIHAGDETWGLINAGRLLCHCPILLMFLF
jgi:hypothetical protein